MSTTSDIGIQLTLKGAEQVKQGLKTISGSAAEMARQFEASRGAILTTAAAVATATGIMVDRVSNAAAEIERFAMLAGSTPQEFQRMAAGAKSAGMDMEKYASTMKDVQDKIGDFLQTGGGELKDFFEKIAPAVGVTAEQFKNLSGPQALQLFYNSLEKANLSQKETVFWMESIADDATALVPLLQNNGAAFDALADRAAKYGGVLSDYALAAAKDFKGQTDEMTLALQGAEQILAVGLMPTLTETARELLATADSAGIADTAATVIRTTLEALVIVASDVAFTFTAVGREIGGMAAQAQAFLSLDFARAGQIRAMMKEDAAGARAELEAFQQRLLNAGQTAKDVFNLSGVMKGNKTGTAEYQAALNALIRMKDDGTVSASQFTAAIKGATAANVSAAAAAGRTGKSLSGMGVGADAAKKAADTAKSAADKARQAAQATQQAYQAAFGNAAQMLRELDAEEQNLNAAEKALADVMAGEHWGKWNEAQRKAIELIYQRNAATIARQQQEQADAKWASESADANANVAESAYEAANAAEAQRDAQLQANAAIGLTALEVANLEAARIDDTAAEKQRLAAIMDGIDPAIAADYRRQAQALTELAEAKRDGAVKDAMAESAKEAADEWKRTADKIEDALIDALMDGGKSGAEYIEDLFRTMVLRPVLQVIVSPVAGAVTSALGFGGGAAQGANALGTVSNLSSLYSAATGGLTASLGSMAASIGTTIGSSAVTAFGAGMQGSTLAAGLAGPTTAGATGAMGLGASFGAAMPWIAGGLSVASILKGMDNSGTPHTGGAGGYSAARGTFRTNDNLKAGDWWNNGYDKTAGGIKGAQELSKILATTLDTAATTFGQKAGYEVWTGFADDASGDPAWSRLFIKNLEGVLVNTNRKFSDGEKGQAEYAKYLAEATRSVLDNMDLPGWADAMLASLGEAPTVEQLSQLVGYFGQVKTALENLGDYLPQLGSLSEAAATQLIGAFGGVENMVAASSAYYQAFYTEAERTATATAQLQEQFGKLGTSMPTTRDAFRDLVESQDLTTESGRETYAALMGLSGAFAAVVPAMQSASAIVEDIEQAYQRLTNLTFTAEQAAEQRIGLEEKLLTLQGNTTELRRRELLAIDASNRGLQRLVWALDDVQTASASVLDAEKKLADAQAQAQQQQYDTQYEAAKAIADAARAAADEMKSLADTLRDFVLGETLTPSELFADTLKKALGGDVEAMRALPQAATAQMDAARQSASTQADYAIARAQTLNAVQAAAAIAGQLGAVSVVDPVRQVAQPTAAQDPTQEALGKLNTAIEVLTMSIATAVGGDLADKLGKIDTNLDGSVSESEFKAAFSGTASDNVLSKIFAALDSDGSKMITKLEAIKSSTSAFATSFGTFSVNLASALVSQSGSLSTSALSAALGAGKDTAASTKTASALDFDGSGVVTKSEAELAKSVASIAEKYASTASKDYISGASTNASSNTDNSLNSVYKELLGRDVDVSGASYYAGKSIESVIADIKSSPEYAVRNAAGSSAQNLLNDLVNSQFGISNSTKAFHTGGYTGPGGKYEAAGVVHRGEVVFSQDDIARLGGVRAVEAIRTGTAPGYADGGVVGSASGPVVVPAPLVPGRVAMAQRPATPDSVQQEREAQARDQAQREAQQQTQDLIAQLRQVNSNLTDLKRSVDKSGQSNDQMNNKIFNMADTTVKLLRKFDALGLPVVQAATEAA